MTEVKNEVVVLNDDANELIVIAERRIAQLDKIVELSLKRTNTNDWVDQNGKPYLTCSGAEKIGRLFGVNWSILESKKNQSEDEKGKFYFYQSTGVFTLKGHDSIEAVGTCSVRDKFFSKAGGRELPVSEIDETNIMKSAYSNCVVNGITRILGIRNLQWEQLEKSGINRSKVVSVAYTKNDSVISDAQVKRLFAILKSSKYTEEELKSHIKETYKIESSKEILKKDYEKICNWVEDKNGN